MKALVTTSYRGVFAGEIADDQDLAATSMPIKGARMAIRFGTTRAVIARAEPGPPSISKISAPADIAMLHGITGVFAITEEAWAKWQAA